MTATVERQYRAYAQPLWRRTLLTRETAVIAMIVAISLWAYSNVPYFGEKLTLTYLLLDSTTILLIALPMTAVIVTGEIDLSVASVVGLASVLFGIMHRGGVPILVAAVIAVLAGLACGLLNGYLVAYVGLPSLAVTIGTLALFRGLAVGLLGTTAVTDFPADWTARASAVIDGTGVPTVMLLFLLLAAGFTWLLHFSPFGRGVFDIGLGPEAAVFTGVDVARTKLLLFALTGAVSAVAGVFYTLRFGSARGDNATGLELTVIAAVLLGGVSIFGGRGRLGGVVAGVLLIGVISSALRLQGITVNVINIIIGALLVLSVISTTVLTRVSGLASGATKASAKAPGDVATPHATDPSERTSE